MHRSTFVQALFSIERPKIFIAEFKYVTRIYATFHLPYFVISESLRNNEDSLSALNEGFLSHLP